MEIIRAHSMGFCFGVRDAIEIVRDLATRARPSTPSARSCTIRKSPKSSKKSTCTSSTALTRCRSAASSRLPLMDRLPTCRARREERGLKVIDTTCPLVTRIQKRRYDLVQQRYSVLVYGDANHKEVKGIVGWSGGKARVIRSMQDLEDWEPTRRVALISQSTSNVEKFIALSRDLVGDMVARGVEVRVINTICKPTKDRQRAVRELAREVDVVIAIGGEASANTRKLVQAAKEEGTQAYQVERPADLQSDWFDDAERIGITAGASTPDSVIDDVEVRIRSFGALQPALA